MARYIRPRRLHEDYGISRVTAWRWSRDEASGFPKAIRLSAGITVYDVAAIEAWFEEKRQDQSR